MERLPYGERKKMAESSGEVFAFAKSTGGVAPDRVFELQSDYENLVFVNPEVIHRLFPQAMEIIESNREVLKKFYLAQPKHTNL